MAETPVTSQGHADSGKVLEEDRNLRGFSHEFWDQADVELVVEGEHTLPCHSAILRLNSKVFDTLLEKESFDHNASKQAGWLSRISSLKQSRR